MKENHLVKVMETRKSTWLGLLAIVSSLLLSSVASAQQVDWPTIKGNNARTGSNGDAGPGVANLRWWTPNGANNQYTTSLVVDNTDFTGSAYNSSFAGGVNPAGLFSTTASGAAAWYADPLSFAVANFDAGAPWLELDPNDQQDQRVPAYIYSTCVASQLNQSPTVGATATATWNFTPTAGVPNLYALYVWVPTGPQDLSTGTGVHGQTFPQEFYVYQIQTQGRTIIDVVDTWVSGGGWVRLGNGGLPTSMVFPYDGINPVTITLFNTIPRDSKGILTGTPGSSVVYADAAKAVPTFGYYDASPVSAQLIAGNPATTRTVAAVNQFSSGGLNNAFTTVATGTVTSYQYDTGAPAWSFSPVQGGSIPVLTDVSPANASPALSFTPDPSLNKGGANQAETTPTVSWDATQVLANGLIPGYTATMSYSPSLNTGTYQVYAYIPGNDSTHSFAKGVQYIIKEGNTSTPVFIDQSFPGGWVQLGGRRFVNQQATPSTSQALLKVLVTNVSYDPANAGNTQDTGKIIYASAIRFVGEQNQSISSTPVIANVNINKVINHVVTPVPTQVVLVADENGYLHCLDSKGNADGTTTEYWSYPSTLPDGVADPNKFLDQDVEMPSGFSLCSALITPVQTGSGLKYYLYVGTRNGRVYCIDMAGRGDGSNENDGTTTTQLTVGSTQRIWTFPSSPGVPISKLGSFRGSVTTNLDPVTGAATLGVPTIYVPTTQGRIYAVNAVGIPATGGAGTGITNELWQYPLKTQPTLGEIWSTPAYSVINGIPYLYFGTNVRVTDDAPGQFYCLNVTNGATAKNPVWMYDGGPITTTVVGETGTVTVNTGDFLSSPAIVSQKTVNASYPATDSFVYVQNQNNYLYVFDALTGIVSTPPLMPSGSPAQPIMSTKELGVGALGALTFSKMTVYNNAGILAPSVPVILVPTLDGRFDALFADPAVANLYGTRRAYEFNTASSMIASSLATSNNWMYGTDESGFLYAFNNDAGSLSPGNPPGSETIVENNPAGNIFRHAKIRLVTEKGHNLLSANPSQLDYNQATQGASNPYTFTRSPLAFEWGESAFILVYDFPYLVTNGTSPVSPPIINVTFSSQGKNVTRTGSARKFPEPPNAPDDPADPAYPSGDIRDNGFAVIQVPLGTGATALPPGPGTISISISSSALNTFGAMQTIALNPAYSHIPFYMANPLAVVMPDPSNPTQPGGDLFSVGLSTSPSDAESLTNGSPSVPVNPNHPAKNINLLGTSGGVAHHGQSTSTQAYLVDRSMMALVNAVGLAKVKMEVKNLTWQGGSAAVWKPLNSTYYANFEDYPTNFPNDSIDYPDISNEQVQIVINPNAAAQNPLYKAGQGVTLNPPMVLDSGTGKLRPLQRGDEPESRVFQKTPVSITINVPRFQPPNTNPQVNAAGAFVGDSDPSPAAIPLSQGYLGRARAFVDSNINGLLDTSPAEAYRGFNLMTSVDVDEKITVSTPSVNLGAQGQGTGYNPLVPGSASGTQGYSLNSNSNNAFSIFQPWDGYYKSLFQPFTVLNEGNVNLLNVRLAKVYAIGGTQPWSIFSTTNDPLGWLDGSLDVWSDIDTIFAPEAKAGTGYNEVIVQKPRVSDTAPTQATANAIRRANPYLGTTGYFTPFGQSIPLPDVANQTLVGSIGSQSLKYPPVNPRVAVSVPLGMPAGAYSQTMRVIEKGTTLGLGVPWFSQNNDWWQTYNNAPETFSDPTFTLNFNVRESRLTTSFTPFTAPMVDNAASASSANPYAYSNKQPAMIRDAFGGLDVAWASDRPSWNPAQPTSASQLGNFMIYMASVNNASTFNSFGITGTPDPLSPLADLNNFTPASNSQWFKQAAAAYPSQSPDTLFGSQSGEAVVPGTVQYTNPTFPQMGQVNPFNPSQKFVATYMAFVGDAQKSTSSGRLGESFIMMAQVSPSSTGLPTPPQPVTMFNDPLVTKGKPSVVQTPVGAMVFYPGTASGQSTVYYSYFNGSNFGPSVALPFGPGFSSVTGVSVAGRQYAGLGALKPDGVNYFLVNGDYVAEMTFTAQQQGRSNPEVFLGRMKVDSSNFGVVDDKGVSIDNAASDGNVFINLSQQVGEALVAGSQPGLYRSLGIQWDPTATIQVAQNLNGVTTSLLVAGTAVYDRETGLISYDSKLGGKVYIDTALGTVRFTAGVPNASAQILATYSPRFLRVSASGGSGYAKATGLYDLRLISNPFSWFTANGTQAGNASQIQSDRYLFTYNRAAGGAGLAPRPYYTSLRYGVQLPYRMAVNNNGVPSINVIGQKRNTSAYQVDPANGRIYFTRADEDNAVSVSYTALREDGTTFNYVLPYQPTVSLIRETSEQQILIDNAVNESDLTAFLDPFSLAANSLRRPPLTWLFWTSTRAGVPDIFFETISPQWPSFAVSQ